MAKSSRLGAKGSFVIRERKVKSFIASVRRHSACSVYFLLCTVLYRILVQYSTVHSQALRLLCCFGGAISIELCSMVSAPFETKGRTPYTRSCRGLYVSLRFSRAACPRHDQKNAASCSSLVMCVHGTPHAVSC